YRLVQFRRHACAPLTLGAINTHSTMIQRAEALYISCPPFGPCMGGAWPLTPPCPLYSPGARGRSRSLSLRVGFLGTKGKPTGTSQAMRREAVRTSGAAA